MCPHRISLMTAAVLLGASRGAAQCQPVWLAETGLPDANHIVWSLTTWDRDGDGPQAPLLVAGGQFTQIGSVSVNCVALWDGSAWLPLGAGLNDRVYALTSWDRDGPGPGGPTLVAAGWFGKSGSVDVNYIAWWDDQTGTWRGFPGSTTGMNDRILDLTLWDRDGVGAGQPELVAGGYFTMAGGITARYTARWENGAGGFAGGAWHAFDLELSDAGIALTSWDSDGNDATPPELVAGGGFATAGGVQAKAIAGWNGSAWHGFSSGMTNPGQPVNNTVVALMPWHSDCGDAPCLVAGGEFTHAGGVEVNHIARWNGSAWLPFASGLNDTVIAVTTWDPDSDGPAPRELIAGGAFDAAVNGGALHGIARWDGLTSAWLPLGEGLSGGISPTPGAAALAVWQPEARNPNAPYLVVGGDFFGAGEHPTLNIACYGICRADYNCDGFVDGIDYDAFMNDFENSDPVGQMAADYNGDGFVDGIDYGGFMNDFEAGC